jgi:hypothetical protein
MELVNKEIYNCKSCDSLLNCTADIYCNIVLYGRSVGTVGPLEFTILGSGQKSLKSTTCDS